MYYKSIPGLDFKKCIPTFYQGHIHGHSLRSNLCWNENTSARNAHLDVLPQPYLLLSRCFGLFCGCCCFKFLFDCRPRVLLLITSGRLLVWRVMERLFFKWKKISNWKPFPCFHPRSNTGPTLLSWSVSGHRIQEVTRGTSEPKITCFGFKRGHLSYRSVNIVISAVWSPLLK